jgi:cytochrome c oxidase assembly protein subunit 15
MTPPSNSPAGYSKPLHTFATVTAVATFVLIIAGGLVTSTGSGLAVPDWPLSYGKLMPEMVGGIVYEHSHRMVAAFVGLLTVVLALWIWRGEQRKWVRVLSAVALTAVVAQGLLGGLTVLFLLPTGVSVGHAALAQTFFCIVVTVALVTSRWWIEEHSRVGDEKIRPSTFILCCAATLAVYSQLIIGALMRHTHSGLAIPDFPLSYGQILPSLSPESMAAYNDQLIHSNVRLAAEGPITSSQIIIHLLHRFWALVVAVLVIWASLRVRRRFSHSTRFRSFSHLLIVLLLVQVALGGLSVLSLKSVIIATAHVATGALLLASSVLMTLQVFRLSTTRVLKMSYSPAGTEAIA